MEAKKITRLDEANSLFEQFEKSGDTAAKDRAVQICNDLCLSRFFPVDSKFLVFRLLLKHYPELADEILARWRDSIVFLREEELNSYLTLLVKVTRCPEAASHERIYTAVHLYNTGFIQVCYTCFADLASDSAILVEHRLEAARFLFAAADDDERECAQECLMEITSDHSYPCKFRYEAIASYISRTGIACLMNTNKLKVPYDEDFVFSLQMPFFHDEKNDIRYRILSGQHLLQMSPEVLALEDKKNVSAILLDIARDDRQIKDVRADAADVVLRLGDSSDRARARNLITELGYSADGEKKTLVPRTIYDNSQNIHDHDINKHVQTFLEKMLAPETSIRLRSYTDVNREISACLRSDDILDPTKRNAAYRALSRVSVDTATFTTHKATLAEILIHVWSRIHSGEFSEKVVKSLEQRMIDELSDMSDTCSSGHAGRFVNVLSTVDDTLRISWDNQIRSNVKGRMQARIRDCDDPDLSAGIALGVMEDAAAEDRKIYMDWLEIQLNEIKIELEKEFVGEGYIKSVDFETYFGDVRNEWMGE